MLKVTQAEYISPKTLKVIFSNQEEYLVNLSDTINKEPRQIWQQLMDEAVFQAFEIDHDTVCWKNGLDVAPEYLYFLGNKDNPELQQQFKAWGYL